MRRLVFASILALTACAAAPPSHWARGGPAIDIPTARWIRGDYVIDLRDDGRIWLNGEHQFTIDRAGRVFDLDQKAVALLEADGNVIGPDDVSLGRVGALHASLPGDAQAWLTVTPAGEVIRYTPEGDRFPMGAWLGQCARSASAHEVCVLVTHLIAMKVRDQRPGFGVTPTIGIGVGIGVH